MVKKANLAPGPLCILSKDLSSIGTQHHCPMEAFKQPSAQCFDARKVVSRLAKQTEHPNQTVSASGYWAAAPAECSIVVQLQKKLGVRTRPARVASGVDQKRNQQPQWHLAERHRPAT